MRTGVRLLTIVQSSARRIDDCQATLKTWFVGRLRATRCPKTVAAQLRLNPGLSDLFVSPIVAANPKDLE
jgi:hypothetical protein